MMSAPTEKARPSWAGPRATGVALLAIGIVALVATTAVHAGNEGWSPAGPRLFPLVVSIGLIVCAIGVLFRATIRRDDELGAHAAAEAAETDWLVPGAIAALLVGYAVALEPLGYILATAVFFPLSCRVLGSRAPRRDVVAGVLLAAAIDFLFTQMLGVPLPAGIVGF